MTAHKSFRDYINLLESFQKTVAEGFDDGDVAGHVAIVTQWQDYKER
jgi:hypothetical protein